MKELSYNEPKNTLYIQTHGYNLQVFRVGDSPKIYASENKECNSKQFKSIHTHFTYEIFFVVSGKLKIVTEAYSKCYQESILIIPPKMKHVTFPIEGESYCLLFYFEKEPEWIFNIKKPGSDSVYELPISKDIAFYIQKLSEKSLQNTNYAEKDAEHLTALIFSDVFELIKSKENLVRSYNERRFKNISAIESFINRNINNKFTLTDVSKSIHLSSRQITRIIEKEYGYTFSRLITEKRLAIAVALLKNTDLKISEISEQTFYGNESYFYTVFKKKYNVSPLQYRKNILAETEHLTQKDIKHE